MMKPKHTEGPWRILPDEGEPYLRIRGTRLWHKFKIANVLNEKYRGIHPQEEEENEANARLIAAAPELYDALLAAHKHLDGWYFDNNPLMETINNALKKVEGEWK